MKLLTEYLIDEAGNAREGVLVEIRVAGTATVQTLYSTNDTGGATKANPLTTEGGDHKGRYQAFVPNGLYDIVIEPGTVDERTDSTVEIIDAKDLNERALLAPAGETAGTLPARASRVNKAMSWDGDGNPSSTGLDDLVNTVEAVKRENHTGKQEKGTVTDLIDDLAALAAADSARPTSAALAATSGAALVGMNEEPVTVEDALLKRRKNVVDEGVSTATADNAVNMQAVLDYAKQSNSITYGALVGMDQKRQVELREQYAVKSSLTLWSKTELQSINGLSGGLTLASDATDDALFLLGGSTGQTAWANEQKIRGGAYNVLKTGGSLVKKDPSFPRNFDAVGGSFMTNMAFEDMDVAAPLGFNLGDVYLQSVRFERLRFVGTTDQMFNVQGHHLMLRDIDKTGFTGTTTAPLIQIGDVDNINPTTHVTLHNVVLDLNGSATKHSINIDNAKNTLIDSYHNELTAFDTMLRVEDSYGTTVRRGIFVTNVTTGLIELVNSDLHMETYEANNVSSWWSAFTIDSNSYVHIKRLRQSFGSTIPIVPSIDVDEMDRASSPAEKYLKVVSKDVIGNLCKNPSFKNGTTGWTLPSGGSPTISVIPGNEVDPGGKVLRLVWASDQAGTFYINQLIPGMSGAEFDDKALTCSMRGKITRSGAQDLTSYMGPCNTSFLVQEGRIYADDGLCVGADIVPDFNGNAYFGIANPRAGWAYDIHLLSANPGRQVSDVLTPKMDTGWTAMGGTLFRGAYNGYTAASTPISATPTQAEIQAVCNAMELISRRQATIESALRNAEIVDG